MNYETLQQQMRVELARRLEVLRTDVNEWTRPARVQAMGISATQRLALVDMMNELDSRQRTLFKAVDQPLAAQAFADGHTNLLLTMAGCQELWRVFRFMLDQHEDVALQRSVKAAARVADDCYSHCIRRARTFNAIAPDRLREAPLVYLEAIDSPATASRRDKVQALSTSVRKWRDLTLPLPIVLLPFDYAQSIWTFCGLHHEVGHNLDQDLKLLPAFRAVLPDTVPADQEIHWRRWSAEILADAFGIVLGGAGFAASLGATSLLLAPGKDNQTMNLDAVHPPFALRVRLIIEMLKLTGVARHQTLATELQAVWDLAGKPAFVLPFAPNAAAVAKLFLDTKVAALGTDAAPHSVLEMNPTLAQDEDRTDALANFFLTGQNRPVPSADQGMHPRLVPCAAQLALRREPALTADKLNAIQEAALKYLDLIPPIQTLAVAAAAAGPAALQQRRAYLKSLAADLDFSTVGVGTNGAETP